MTDDELWDASRDNATRNDGPARQGDGVKTECGNRGTNLALKGIRASQMAAGRRSRNNLEVLRFGEGGDVWVCGKSR